MCKQLNEVFVVGLLDDQVINLSGPRERPVHGELNRFLPTPELAQLKACRLEPSLLASQRKETIEVTQFS